MRSIFVFVLFIVLASCSTRREALSVDDRHHVESVLSLMTKKDSTLSSRKVDVSLFEGKLVIEEIEYDTDNKNTDPGSKPVVKRRKKTSLDFNSKYSTDMVSDSDYKESTESRNSTSSDSNTVISSTKEKEGSSFVAYLHKILVSIIILIITLLLYRLFSCFLKHK